MNIDLEIDLNFQKNVRNEHTLIKAFKIELSLVKKFIIGTIKRFIIMKYTSTYEILCNKHI